jgi:hypothetical protein
MILILPIDNLRRIYEIMSESRKEKQKMQAVPDDI